ncbi:MAG TPA: hypothetical protein VGE65_10395, partial [Sphingobium sp.]
PFWSWVAPGLLLDLVSPMLLFIGAVLLVGLFTQDRRPIESLRIYLVALVLFSSAISNQYLAIPATSIAVSWNGAYASYSVFGTFFLAVHSDGLQLEMVANALHWVGNYGYETLTMMLAAGLAIDLLGQERLAIIAAPVGQAWRSFRKRAKAQLSAPFY